MGLRQSKRSVDITASPKKDAASTEKVVQASEPAVIVEKIEEEVKANGDTKTAELAEPV